MDAATEVDMIVENGDVFFPDFDADEFDVSIGEVGGEDIKFTRAVYTRKQRKY